MAKTKLLLTTLFTLLLIGILLLTIDGSPLRDWLQQRAAGETSTVAVNDSKVADTTTVAGPELGFEEVQFILNSVNVEQRRSLLSDEQRFREFARQEARKRSLLAAARANGFHNNPEIDFLMQRAANEILERVYLEQLLSQQLPADFPSSQQVQEYYRNNQGQFRLPERIPVWQVFLPQDAQADPGGIEALREQAAEIAADIESGTLSFAEAVLQYSAHQASRNNGGYMGLLNVNEIRPEIKEPLLALAAGSISEPITSPQGVHIFRRGESVAGRDVALDEVRPQVRELLRQQAANRLRESIYSKASESFPVELTERQIEEWRLRLRTNTTTGTAPSPGS